MDLKLKPMEKIPYNERVQQIAEEMANYAWLEYMSNHLSSTSPKHQERQIEIKMPYARIAVAKMAEAAATFMGTLSDYGRKKRLTEWGLIPEKTAEKEAGNDENSI